jgi:hypothetical protein
MKPFPPVMRTVEPLGIAGWSIGDMTTRRWIISFSWLMAVIYLKGEEAVQHRVIKRVIRWGPSKVEIAVSS